jgi:hypothetical protein
MHLHKGGRIEELIQSVGVDCCIYRLLPRFEQMNNAGLG